MILKRTVQADFSQFCHPVWRFVQRLTPNRVDQELSDGSRRERGTLEAYRVNGDLARRLFSDLVLSFRVRDLFGESRVRQTTLKSWRQLPMSEGRKEEKNHYA